MKVIPLYIGAGITGFESPATEYKELNLSLDQLMIANPSATFIGKCQGNSMIKKGIFSGDYLIVDRARPVKDGDVIVANLNGEFVCKIFDKVNARLLSAADGYDPVAITEYDEFQIEGVVPFSVRLLDESFSPLCLP